MENVNALAARVAGMALTASLLGVRINLLPENKPSLSSTTVFGLDFTPLIHTHELVDGNTESIVKGQRSLIPI